MEQQRRTIMVDLDTLLDTRIALLFRRDIDHESVNGFTTLLRKEYATRQTDAWIAEVNGFPVEEWQQLWSTRQTLNILPLAKQTYSIKAILDYINDNVNQQIKPTRGDEYDLLINTYPYRLDEEISALICEMLDEQLVILGNISTCYMSLEQLTPAYVKEKLDSLWLYDYGKWLDLHMPYLVENPRPTIQLMCPKLVKPVPEGEPRDELEERMLKELDPFELLTGTLSMFVSVQFIPTFFYSVTPDMIEAEIEKIESQKKEES